MKRIHMLIAILMISVVSTAIVARTNSEVDQFRYKTITFSSAESVTIDSNRAYTSDAFYIGDGNNHPKVFNVFMISDLSSDSIFYTATLKLSNDGTNYTTTATSVSTESLGGDTNKIVNFTTTNVPYARWGKLIITPSRDDSTMTFKAQRGAIY